MAFSIDCVLKGYEFRGYEQGTSKKGNQYMSIRLESPSGKTCEVSTTDQNVFPGIRAMKKGDVADWQVAAIAGKERSFIIMTAAPTVCEL